MALARIWEIFCDIATLTVYFWQLLWENAFFLLIRTLQFFNPSAPEDAANFFVEPDAQTLCAGFELGTT